MYVTACCLAIARLAMNAGYHCPGLRGMVLVTTALHQDEICTLAFWGLYRCVFRFCTVDGTINGPAPGVTVRSGCATIVALTTVLPNAPIAFHAAMAAGRSFRSGIRAMSTTGCERVTSRSPSVRRVNDHASPNRLKVASAVVAESINVSRLENTPWITPSWSCASVSRATSPSICARSASTFAMSSLPMTMLAPMPRRANPMLIGLKLSAKPPSLTTSFTISCPLPTAFLAEPRAVGLPA